MADDATGGTRDGAGHATNADDDPIQVQAKRLCTSIREAADAHSKQKAEVASERARLDQEKHAMEAVQAFPAGRIKLDVGGTLFTASRASLCRVSGSMLESMFSGRHALTATDDSSYFIDRDGTHFRYILNYLRTGAITAPENAASKAELATEADFYCLTALSLALRAPAMNLLEMLGQEVLDERASEAAMRNAFAARSAQSLNAHHGLVSMFAEQVAAELSYHPGAAVATPLLAALHTPAAPGQAVVVSTLGAFRANFNRLHANVLNRLAPLLQTNPIFIAGGAVLQALTCTESKDGTRTAGWWGSPERLSRSDVDVFLHSVDAAAASALTKRIVRAIAVNSEHWVIARSNGVMNVMLFDLQNGQQSVVETVQIVLRLYQSPAEILACFDVDCICCGFDGTAVWALPRCLRALRTGCNILNPLHAWPNRPAYELRLGKYATRGWPVAVPSLATRSIDHDQIRRSQLAELHGLAKLIKVAHVMDASRAPARQPQGNNLPESDLTRKRSLESAPFPEDCRSLREPWVDGLSELDVMMRGIHSYDETPQSTIIPSVFKDNNENGPLSAYEFRYCDNIQEMSASIFSQAWYEIADAGSDIERPPRRLADAWSDGSRSREYLNAEVDAMTLTSQYYAHAYVDERAASA